MNDLFSSGDEPVLMGIVNVTPDSFSDGGKYLSADKAIEHGLRLYSEGACILDIGGESTRPGAEPVSLGEELSRVIPVIEGLKGCGAVISIDTRHADVMNAAIKAGATFINDISALEHDPKSLQIAVQSGSYVCLMHMRGEPKTMQMKPQYDDVFAEVYEYLCGRIDVCIKAGVKRERISIDPGIGFGKSLEHNLVLLNRLKDFSKVAVPVLLGTSRKRFIEDIYPQSVTDQRLAGSLASCLAAYDQGVRIFRVHDVKETAQALAVYRRIKKS